MMQIPEMKKRNEKCTGVLTLNIATLLTMFTLISLIWCFVFKTAHVTFYTGENATDVFDVFKEKYNKVYKSAAEEKTRLKAFVKNLNIVDELNEVTKDHKTFFILNQYADLDPREIEEHYAVNVKPYYNVSNNQEAEYLGRQRGQELNTSELYDLNNAAQLYESYMSKYNKEKHKKKFNYTIHFYRFVKTLVEKNRNIHQGNENKPLDETADVLKEPYEYFF